MKKIPNNKLIWAARILVGLLFIFSGLVKINDPRGSSLAGAVAMPVWRDVAEYAVQLFGIPPEK